jgi:predicted nuclease of predicted toxin-antitoxin system
LNVTREGILKFLVDVGVGKAVEVWLRERGYDTKFVREIDPRTKDIEILRMADSEARMVITMDKDFGELVYNSKSTHSGVLILRLEAATGVEKVEIIKRILETYSGKIDGKFCVFQDGKLRVRS